MNNNLAKIRNEYTLQGLEEHEIATNPISQFDKWFNEVITSEITESNAMVLSTAFNNRPSSRVVLLKGYDENGFVFFTNYHSDKGQQIAANSQVSLNFFWKELERQVRIEGIAVKVSESESDEYFQERPIGSQFGAWASNQSETIANRQVIEDKLLDLKLQYGEGPVPRPSHWGGYRVVPTLIEFWQGRASRLHDRIVYLKDSDSHWNIKRLSP